jgi:hypothetical protein
MSKQAIFAYLGMFNQQLNWHCCTLKISTYVQIYRRIIFAQNFWSIFAKTPKLRLLKHTIYVPLKIEIFI